MYNESFEINDIEKTIGYQFKDKMILLEAITHKSYVNESAGVSKDYQRLEFLGDSILNAIIGIILFDRLKDANEGRLTLIRAHLVSTKTLAKKAKLLNIGRYIRVGKGAERKDGVHHSARVLCECLEAIIGAVYVDGGFDVCKKVVEKLYEPEELLSVVEDPKSCLQKRCLARYRSLPRYNLIEIQGSSHNPTFKVKVTLPSEEVFIGVGKSKREAEKRSAEEALKSWKEEG